MWYEQSYTVRFMTLLRSVGIIFEETFDAIFSTRTDFFAVLMVGILMMFVVGLFLYIKRKTKKM